MYIVFRFMKIFFVKNDVDWRKKVGIFAVYYLVNSFGFMVFRNPELNVATNMILCLPSSFDIIPQKVQSIVEMAIKNPPIEPSKIVPLASSVLNLVKN